ncbi:MAG: RodZ domain-containing protein [Halomonas sp.]|uniref:RodZ domain-containing protein n=1 Tax=Halomonas sp. TaxID=1486246 RepID=UPI003F923B30
MSDTQPQESVINSTNIVSPGELLSRQREQLGVPLADAARALNLRPAVVNGLEQDNYQEIPVAAYRRGYLRAYAKYLGMDDRLVLEAYQALHGSIDAERKVIPVSTTRPPSRIGAWLFKLVTLLVIVGLIAVTVMWWQSRGGNEPPGLGSSSTEETVNAQAESPEAESAAVEPSITSGAAPTSQEQAGGADTVAIIDPPRLVATDDAPPVETAAVESDPEDTADATTTTNANVLELTFNEQSWTEIFDATNQRIFVGLQTPGTSTSVEGQPPFRLTIGNATGVELRYQGEEVDLPAQAGANNVARFNLGE